jgi:hypothetical protein
MNWQETLQYWLCELYKTFGGLCTELGQTPVEAVDRFLEVYEEEGAPSIDGEVLSTFLSNLTSLETHLALPGNTLDFERREELAQQIADLRSDLGEA